MSSSKREVIVPSLFRNLVRSSAEEALNLAGLPYSSMLHTWLHGVIINSVLLDARLTDITVWPRAASCMDVIHFDIRRQGDFTGLRRSYDIFPPTFSTVILKKVSLSWNFHFEWVVRVNTVTADEWDVGEWMRFLIKNLLSVHSDI